MESKGFNWGIILVLTFTFFRNMDRNFWTHHKKVQFLNFLMEKEDFIR